MAAKQMEDEGEEENFVVKEAKLKKELVEKAKTRAQKISRKKMKKQNEQSAIT